MRNQKAVMVAAIAAAFATPAAFADVTISGAINMGLEYVNTNDGTAPNAGGGQKGVSHFGISNSYSNITISSVEDLGGGLKLDFAYQMWIFPGGAGGYAGTAAGEATVNRNSHIGLVGESWGGFWYGTNENLYERYFYSIDPLDGAYGLGGGLQILGNPGAQVFAVETAGNSAAAYTFYRRDTQSVWYDSPNFNGFTFGVVAELNAAKTNDTAFTTSGKANPYMWQVGAKYVGPTIPVQAWIAYARRKDEFGLIGFASSAPAVFGAQAATQTDGSTDQALQLGAAYTLGDITVFANFERLKYKLDGVFTGEIDEWKRNAFSVGLKWVLPTGYIGAQYVQALDAHCNISGVSGCPNDDKTGAKMLAASYFHTLSKQTQAYVTVNWLDNKDNGTYGSAGIGASNMTAPGTTVWGVGIGLKHSF